MTDKTDKEKSNTDNDDVFEKAVKRLLKMPAKKREKGIDQKENDGPDKQGRQNPKD